MSNSENRKHSSIQYFLWLISGSEISTLKNCPNDYNRHANIGLMIFITSLFAGLTGFIAGHTFAPDNNLAVGLFAFVWAFLIFSLDRSMVNSIKKDPTIPEKSMWGYFWPRLLLAVILAFFMSIPLDHIVFKERIQYQMDINNNKDIDQRTKNLASRYNVKSDSISSEKANDRADNINEELNGECTLPDYISKVREYNICKSQLTAIPPKIKVYYKYRKDKPMPIPNYYYKSNPQYLIKSKECRSYKQEADSIDRNWRMIKQNEATTSRLNANRLTARKDSNNIVITNKTDSLETRLEKMKDGFDTQFVTLFLMPNGGVQFLKWLIFLALLVIEILPTFLKLRTPIGQYDWEMHKQEKITELETVARINVLSNELKNIEDYRSDKEIVLNKKIIDKVVDIEEALANEMLVEWEAKARNQLKDDVNNAN